MLAEFVVVSWHGHRDDDAIPEVVRTVWQKKFQRGGSRSSNVDACVLDSRGALVRTFDAMPIANDGRPDLRGTRLADHWHAELTAARGTLGLGPAAAPRPVALPALPADAKTGMRVFTQLFDQAMPAYRAPVVELVPMDPAAWQPLALPTKPRTVGPMDLLPWLSRLFPGGIMERTDQATKKVYDVMGATGDLTLAPAGSAGSVRFARLSGRVKLTDSGGGDFAFGGELALVLTYGPDASEPDSARGFLEGTYPRRTPKGERELRLVGVFESVAR